MNIIAAVYSDFGIGINGTQPIVIPEDRENFAKLTKNGVIIAGRKTYQGFPNQRPQGGRDEGQAYYGSPLPGRRNIVLSRDRNFIADGACVVHSIEEAMDEISDYDQDKVFVVGGGDIYRQFLQFCTNAYITKIAAIPRSDTFFPNLDKLPEWSIVYESPSYDHVLRSVNLLPLLHKSASKTHEACRIKYSFVLYRNSNPRSKKEQVYV